MSKSTMNEHRFLHAAWTDFLPESIRGHLDGPLGIVILLAVGAVAIFLLAWIASKIWKAVVGTSSGPVPKEKHENLVEYPPPPSLGERQLFIDGIPVRARLVIMAPVGKEMEVTQDTVPSILEEIVTGLGTVVQSDKPRVVIWPPQLSLQGFAPTFHRLVDTPEPEGQASPWILIAGPAQMGSKKVLLGMALLAEKHNVMGRRTVAINRWTEMLQTKSTS